MFGPKDLEATECNSIVPATQPRHKDYKFKTSMGSIARLCLKNKRKEMKCRFGTNVTDFSIHICIVCLC